MWSADGQFIYYVSECFGTPANIVRQDAEGKTKPAADHLPQGRRRPPGPHQRQRRLDRLRVRPRPLGRLHAGSGAPPRKLAIEVHADDKANTERTDDLHAAALSEFALSRRREARRLRRPRRAVPDAAVRRQGHPPDRQPGLRPRHRLVARRRKIIFASDRNGHEDLYLLEADDPEQPEFVKAHKFKVKQLTNTPEAEFGVSFSPDGKRVAFLRAGKLWTMKPDGTDQKALVDDVQVFDYDWSPDCKWLVYARAGRLVRQRAVHHRRRRHGGGTRQEHHPLRHLQRRRHLEQQRQEDGLHQPAPQQRRPVRPVACKSRPPAGAPETKTPGHRLGRHPPARRAAGADPGRGGSHLAGRQQGGFPLDRFQRRRPVGGQHQRRPAHPRSPRATCGRSRSSGRRRLPDLIYFRDGSGSLRHGQGGPGRCPPQSPSRPR